MRQTAMANAMRSGLVVMGALAFGYLSLHLGFKPFLEKAQRTMDLELELERSKSQQQQQQQQQQQPFDFPDTSSSIVRD